jgi:pentapeptide MXKDX repeat protein
MKKLLTLLFSVAIAFSLTTATFAQDTMKKDDTKKEDKKEKKAKKDKKDKKGDKMDAKDDKMKDEKK